MDAEPTKFMPAEKAPQSEILRHQAMIQNDPTLIAVLDGMINYTMVMNMQRQVVYANKPFREFLSSKGVADITGQRTGNLFGCGHPDEPGGCGTTESCTYCGAGRAFYDALEGRFGVYECRILPKKSGDELDLRISMSSFPYGGERFLLMALIEISSEKRRQALERIFFHDILNTASGVRGLLRLMASSKPAEALAYVPSANTAAAIMMDQLISQRDLAAAERGELKPRSSVFRSRGFLEEMANLFSAAVLGRNAHPVSVSPDSADFELRTDHALCSRVIGNLVKNAVEAEPGGGAVTLSCSLSGDRAQFTVHNPTPMNQEASLQVFQRSFSTKGAGRGLGTYSVRLLTEKYLKGFVSVEVGPGGNLFKINIPVSA